MAGRYDCKLLVYNCHGKLAELSISNKEAFTITLNESMNEMAIIGFCLFSILTILKNSDICNIPQLSTIIDQMRKANFPNIAALLAKRVGSKIPLIYTSNNMMQIGTAWKIMFNVFLQRRLINANLPNALYSDSFTYNIKDENFYSVIIKDADDPRPLKDDIENFKQKIKKNGNNVIEIAMSGNEPMLRALSSILICYQCIEYLKNPTLLS
jgi:hypothetical protein